MIRCLLFSSFCHFCLQYLFFMSMFVFRSHKTKPTLNKITNGLRCSSANRIANMWLSYVVVAVVAAATETATVVIYCFICDPERISSSLYNRVLAMLMFLSFWSFFFTHSFVRFRLLLGNVKSIWISFYCDHHLLLTWHFHSTNHISIHRIAFQFCP